MTKLYSELATVYYEMYQTLFNYKQEFKKYHDILRRYQCRSVLELACGNGQLTPYFMECQYDYCGLDLYNEMLTIARINHPDARFVRGDMCDLQFDEKFDAIIIPGRSFCYMTTNDDMLCAFASIQRTSKQGGIFVFDNFKADAIFADFKQDMQHCVAYQTRRYIRDSQCTPPNLATGWIWNWDATYTVEEAGKEMRVYHDTSVLRAFIKEELSLLLQLANFEIKELFADEFSFLVVAG
ncbi:class I SAM-dependent methyltransferase [candidate division KSB1 bacterium]|nr:class I SAM-dependent methyltransferase [candidate division KSB1 bacterium]